MKYRLVVVAVCLFMVFGAFAQFGSALDCGVTKFDVIKSIVAHITQRGDISKDEVIYLIRANLGGITNCAAPDVTNAISKASLISDDLVPKCSDGTLFAYCSLDEPKYCYNGRLVERCDLCCPSGVCYDSGGCEPPTHVNPSWVSNDFYDIKIVRLGSNSPLCAELPTGNAVEALVEMVGGSYDGVEFWVWIDLTMSPLEPDVGVCYDSEIFVDMYPQECGHVVRYLSSVIAC